jgi:NADPH:quinone reductase-like Zn-dependent oxidoreductase
LPDGPRVDSLGVESAGTARVFSWHDDARADADLAVDTVFSGLSAGTELTFFKGTNPYLHSSWDDDCGVFRPGRPARSYPVETMGYMEVARVAASRRPDLEPGQLVAMAYGHKTSHSASPGELAIPLPADVDPLLGVYVAQMGPICANGVLHAAADRCGPDVASLGDGVRDANVLVTGGGVVGLLTALFAHRHGAAAVAVADPSPKRLAAVDALGLVPVDDQDGGAADWCKRHWGGPGDRGADLVFQCRGRYDALHEALRSLRPQGTVVDLAFYAGGGDRLRLGEEFHHNGLTIRCAQIGRVPRGLERSWDRARLAGETIALLREHGDTLRDRVITDVVPLAEGPRLLRELADRRREPIQAVFAVGGSA